MFCFRSPFHFHLLLLVRSFFFSMVLIYIYCSRWQRGWIPHLEMNLLRRYHRFESTHWLYKSSVVRHQKEWKLRYLLWNYVVSGLRDLIQETHIMQICIYCLCKWSRHSQIYILHDVIYTVSIPYFTQHQEIKWGKSFIGNQIIPVIQLRSTLFIPTLKIIIWNILE